MNEQEPITKYTPPDPELDLNWGGLKTSQKRDLLEHWIPIQQEGIRLGIAPTKPIGIMAPKELFRKWERNVWIPWQKHEGVYDTAAGIALQGRQHVSHSVQPPNTRRTTLRTS
jgi:hypothetical protein